MFLYVDLQIIMIMTTCDGNNPITNINNPIGMQLPLEKKKTKQKKQNKNKNKKKKNKKKNQRYNYIEYSLHPDILGTLALIRADAVSAHHF